MRDVVSFKRNPSAFTITWTVWRLAKRRGRLVWVIRDCWPYKTWGQWLAIHLWLRWRLFMKLVAWICDLW